LILHYTAGDFPVSLKTLTEGTVSSHYLVDDCDGQHYRLVDETRAPTMRRKLLEGLHA